MKTIDAFVCLFNADLNQCAKGALVEGEGNSQMLTIGTISFEKCRVSGILIQTLPGRLAIDDGSAVVHLRCALEREFHCKLGDYVQAMCRWNCVNGLLDILHMRTHTDPNAESLCVLQTLHLYASEYQVGNARAGRERPPSSKRVKVDRQRLRDALYECLCEPMSSQQMIARFPSIEVADVESVVSDLQLDGLIYKSSDGKFNKL